MEELLRIARPRRKFSENLLLLLKNEATTMLKAAILKGSLHLQSGITKFMISVKFCHISIALSIKQDEICDKLSIS